MGDWIEDLRTRWRYHPTFRLRVVLGGFAQVAGVLGMWLAMSPECRQDLDYAVTEGTQRGEADSIQACLDSP